MPNNGFGVCLERSKNASSHQNTQANAEIHIVLGGPGVSYSGNRDRPAL